MRYVLTEVPLWSWWHFTPLSFFFTSLGYAKLKVCPCVMMRSNPHVKYYRVVCECAYVLYEWVYACLILVLLWCVFVCTSVSESSIYWPYNSACSLSSSSAVFTWPESQSASPGDIVLFICTNNASQGLPLWFVNGVEHSPSDLPPGHWVNSSGLVVQARQDLNGARYKCEFILPEGNTKIRRVTRPEDPEAVLTVSQSGKPVVIQCHWYLIEHNLHIFIGK